MNIRRRKNSKGDLHLLATYLSDPLRERRKTSTKVRSSVEIYVDVLESVAIDLRSRNPTVART